MLESITIPEPILDFTPGPIPESAAESIPLSESESAPESAPESDSTLEAQYATVTESGLTPEMKFAPEWESALELKYEDSEAKSVGECPSGPLYLVMGGLTRTYRVGAVQPVGATCSGRVGPRWVHSDPKLQRVRVDPNDE